MLYSIVAVLVIIIDQAVKYWVSNTLFGSDIVSFIPGVLSLVNVHNDGAAFSFLSGGGARIYFIVITAVFTLLVIIALATNFISGKVSRWSLVFITAGGLANCIDRIIYGYVVDMFKVELFNFAVFNVADAFITIFAVIFALAMIFERQSDDDEYEDEEDEDEEPVKPKRGSKRARRNDVNEAEYDEEPVKPKRRSERAAQEETEVRPARRQKKADAETEEPVRRARKTEQELEPGRKARKPNYSQEYEQYKAQRAEREKRNGTAERQTPAAQPAADADNPFAEWERANARVDSQRGSSLAAKAMGTNPPSYARTETPARKPARAEAAQTAAPAAEVRKPAAEVKKPAAPVSSEEFSLDDILAEFK